MKKLIVLIIFLILVLLVELAVIYRRKQPEGAPHGVVQRTVIQPQRTFVVEAWEE